MAVDSRCVACLWTGAHAPHHPSGGWRDRANGRVARSGFVGEGCMPISSPAATAARWSQLRLRRTAHLRDMCAETSFTTAHLVQPLFVVEGLQGTEAVPGL